jgi:hypothetical protein
MRPQRIRDIFALFFDPRLPLLFVVGSIVLAVLGNAIYSLLTFYTGSEPTALIGIIVSALLIFAAVVAGFRAVVRLLQRAPISANIPQEDRAEPHVGLMILVSQNPTAAEQAMITFHHQRQTLKHCWLIVSPETHQRVQSLQYELSEKNITPHLVPISDANQALVVFDSISMALLEAQRTVPSDQLIVDITGGTKIMTTGAVLAALHHKIALQYAVTPRDKDGNIPPNAVPTAMRVTLQTEQS